MNSPNIKPCFFLKTGVYHLWREISLFWESPCWETGMIHQEWKDSCASQSVHHHIPRNDDLGARSHIWYDLLRLAVTQWASRKHTSNLRTVFLPKPMALGLGTSVSCFEDGPSSVRNSGWSPVYSHLHLELSTNGVQLFQSFLQKKIKFRIVLPVSYHYHTIYHSYPLLCTNILHLGCWEEG